MIEVKNVSAGYEGKSVVSDANVIFEEGKITVLVGPNGCGKSTLLKSVVGIVPYTAGDILIKGISTKKCLQNRWRRKLLILHKIKKHRIFR